MKKRLLAILPAVLAVSVALGAAALAAGEKPVSVRAGDVLLTVTGNASPKRLPRHGLAPVSFHTSARIATVDGGQPPALSEVTADVGKAGTIEAGKFPSCPQHRLEATTTEQAKSACPTAIVGSGRGEVEVQFPEQQPFTAKGPLTLFNGGERNGKALLLIHAYVNVPAPTAIVSPVWTSREHKGPYRLHSVATIPAIAGGAGSVTYFYFNIDRKGYLTANCSNGHFSAHVDAKFRDGTDLAASFQKPCTPIG
ncbi:MAG TPA: hypothetical protein VGF09_03595 [Solirubrobacterales bacterium]